ncbi:hypothetical protein EWM64_g4729 [Hericium alpestre]|uniref:DUF6534 domain-containing protein n=1 Tax=Hericium alpestre TaxID=135208 RepID=A0A4Y9ZZ08_9AGAM|nr:hypothetical protein EWM64_g4729 [Hericium alpestre]
MDGGTITNIQTVPGAPENLLLLWCLYGILFLQLYLYYLSFPTDNLWIKITVYGLFIVDTFHTVIVTDVGWSFLCKGWGDLNALRFTSWGFDITPLVSGIAAAWVQLFFAWRIWTLGMRGNYPWIWKIVTILIVLVALAQGIAGMAAGIRFISLADIAQFHIIYGSASTWLAGSAACDVMIALSMVILLSGAKKRAFGTKSERLLSRLIQMTIETGAVTATAAVLDLAFFLGQPENNLHLLMALLLAKLYTNTLYATLNSRAQFHRRTETGTVVLGSGESYGGRSQTTGLSGIKFPNAAGGDSGSGTVIHVNQITELHQDPARDSERKAYPDEIPMHDFP